MAWMITGVVAILAEDANFQECPVRGRSDDHCQIAGLEGGDRVADGVPDVVVRDAVFPCWFTYAHIDKIPCLASRVQRHAGQHALFGG